MAGSLNHTPAHIVAQMISDMGLSSGWGLGVDSMADTPEKMITVFNTTGRDTGRIQFDGSRTGPEGVEVMVRAGGQLDGWRKSDGIAIAFDEQVNNREVVRDGTRYHVQSITRTGSVNSLGYEEGTKRRLYSLNALVFVRQMS